MNMNSKSKNRFIHLYNPKTEGLGSYDVHYINAYKKVKNIQKQTNENNKKRHVA